MYKIFRRKWLYNVILNSKGVFIKVCAVKKVIYAIEKVKLI